MYFDSFSYTSRGGKTVNQDHVGATLTPAGAVYVVADGLGGHRHGDLASKAAVDTLLSTPPEADEDPVAWLERQIGQANEAVLSLIAQNGTTKSTIAALVIQEDRAAWANVGDSRVYYLHNKRIESVTEDHSVAYKRYCAGEITRNQIGADLDQSSLLRALGNRDRATPDCVCLEHPLSAWDGFLLCSDGVWVYLQDEEILVDYLKADSAETWAELLLLRVMERIPEGNDNLSIITVMVKRQEG